MFRAGVCPGQPEESAQHGGGRAGGDRGKAGGPGDVRQAQDAG